MPASEAQIRANREDSMKANGATTPAGRAVIVINPRKHELIATRVLLGFEPAVVRRRYEATAARPRREAGNPIEERFERARQEVTSNLGPANPGWTTIDLDFPIDHRSSTINHSPGKA